MKIYLAAPLFSESEFLYNEILADQFIAMGYEVYAPQRNTAINDKTKSADSIAIFNGDTEQLESSDILVAVLDGIAVDAGVAAEIGYMAAKGKKIYGLLTDGRESSKTVNQAKIEMLNGVAENQFSYVNLYVVGAIKMYGEIFTSRQDLMEHLEVILKYKIGDNVLITSTYFNLENFPAVVMSDCWIEDEGVIMLTVTPADGEDGGAFDVMLKEIVGFNKK